MTQLPDFADSRHLLRPEADRVDAHSKRLDLLLEGVGFRSHEVGLNDCFRAGRFWVVLRMSREEIGSYLGLKLETVSRLMSKFHSAGLIHVAQRQIRITDRRALAELLMPQT